MRQEIIMTLLFTLYLIADSKQDSAIIAKGGHIFHQWNWVLRAIAGIIAAYGLYELSWASMGYSIFLCTHAWIVFDISINLWLKRHPLKYIGSGRIDELFKDEFGHKAPRVLWYVKLSFLVISITIYLLLLL